MATVADIRKAIAGLPDNAPVVVLILPCHADGADGGLNSPRIATVAGLNANFERLEIDIIGST